jgi:ketosteroid isomerase-like protein
VPGDRAALLEAFRQFATGDFRSATRLYDPAVEWMEHRPVPGGGEFAGIDGVRAGFRGWLASWDTYRLELLELVDAGDRFLAAVRGSGRGALSGAYAQDLFFQVWTFRRGKVIRIENFAERDEAEGALRRVDSG